MDENREDKPPSQSPVGNPVTGAITFGLISAALVAIGAAVRGHDIWKMAIITMSGGGITGGVAGAIGYCLYIYNEDRFKSFESSLECCALFSAPLAGLVLSNILTNKRELSYLRLLIDLLVGTAIAASFICIGVLAIFIIVGYIYNRNIFTHLLCCTWCNVAHNNNINDAPQTTAAFVVTDITVECVATTVACEAAGVSDDCALAEIESVDCRQIV